eukprot:scaffold133382_cov48-Phaeocystis_antarctica.AAC.2
MESGAAPPLARRRPLRRVARLHRRGALVSATRRGGVHPAGAFCSSSMAHAPPLYPMRGSAPPRRTWNLHNLTAPAVEPGTSEPEGEYGFATKKVLHTRRKSEIHDCPQ